MPVMLTQTWAIFVDAYRELNSKRLFWIVLVLSGLIVAAFAAIGIGPSGITILVWETGVPPTTDMLPRDVFYKSIFMGFGFQFWLSWIATILALVSTAGMFVDLVSSGSVELVLSKPIGRLRLFVTKYLAGLLFVTAQVGVFSVASFLVLGWRGGVWEPAVFWGVPLVVVFFSYLFCICVLLGILTRSTVASLLLTLLIWLLIFALHASETGFLWGRESSAERVAIIERDIRLLEESLAAPEQATTPDGEEAQGSLATGVRDHLSRAWRAQKLEHRRQQLPEAKKKAVFWRRLHGVAYGLKTALPKTSETIGLLERKLIEDAELAEISDDTANQEVPWETATADDVRVDQQAVQERLIEKTRQRPASWVVGTSLGFELVVLGAAAWIFCRRDF